MGNTTMCCAIPTNHISVQKYIYQINRYYDGSSLEESKQKLYKKRSISIQVMKQKMIFLKQIPQLQE